MSDSRPCKAAFRRSTSAAVPLQNSQTALSLSYLPADDAMDDDGVKGLRKSGESVVSHEQDVMIGAFVAMVAGLRGHIMGAADDPGTCA
mmetsp:Transcript_115088/g.235275  ORF Transcript_115088/g.235275 Transcript_115088/m.235275 type:complete len:89 (+) Transcript_115088:1019-1285(+)